MNGRFSISIYVTGIVHTVMLYVLLILRTHSPACQQCVAFILYLHVHVPVERIVDLRSEASFIRTRTK